MSDFRIISVHRNTPLFAVMQAEGFSFQTVDNTFVIIDNGIHDQTHSEVDDIYPRLLHENKVADLFVIDSQSVSHGAALDRYFEKHNWTEPYTIIVDSDCFLLMPNALEIIRYEIESMGSTGLIEKRFGIPMFHISLLCTETSILRHAWLECRGFQSDNFEQSTPKRTKGHVAFFDQGVKIGLYLKSPYNRGTEAPYCHLKGGTSLFRDILRENPLLPRTVNRFEQLDQALRNILKRNPEWETTIQKYGINLPCSPFAPI